MRRLMLLATWLFSAVALLSSPLSWAAGDKVTVRAWIGAEHQAQTYSVNQQVMLYVDVATTRWFTGGTQISHIEVENLLAKQRSTLATNSTETQAGETWSHQRWEINLYPQASGRYTIPPLAVKVKVSLANGQNAQKTLYTTPLYFSAALPSGELSGDAWLAAPKVSATQSWQSSSEALHVGDSVTRRVTISADDSLSILLPNLLDGASQTPGYQRYGAPPELGDSQNRGSYLSTRTDSETYVLQRGGEVVFPPLTLSWWNTKTQTLEHITLEGQRVAVKHTWQSWLRAYAPWLIGVGVILALVLAALLGVRRYYRHRPLPLRVQFRRAVAARQWGRARVLVYQKLRRLTGLTTLRAYQSLQERESGMAPRRGAHHQLATGEIALPASEQPNAFWALWQRIKALGSERRDWRKPLAIEEKLGLQRSQAFIQRE